MPLPRAMLEEIARRRAAEQEAARRDTRRDLLWTAVRCVFWCIAGLFLMAWGFHTTDEAFGRHIFWAGVFLGNGGIIFSLLGAYRRGERRGDW